MKLKTFHRYSGSITVAEVPWYTWLWAQLFRPLGFTLFIVACGFGIAQIPKPDYSYHHHYDGVESVLLQTQRSASFIVVMPDGTRKVQGNEFGAITLIYDVPEGKLGWADATRDRDSNNEQVVIHTHAKDLQGGGWDHGKGGKGTTVLIP